MIKQEVSRLVWQAGPDGGTYREMDDAEYTAYLEDRNERNHKEAIEENKEQSQGILDQTDWTQIPNNGLTEACVVAFKEYRDAIRVIRQSDAPEAEWPVKPQLEWS